MSPNVRPSRVIANGPRATSRSVAPGKNSALTTTIEPRRTAGMRRAPRDRAGRGRSRRRPATSTTRRTGRTTGGSRNVASRTRRDRQQLRDRVAPMEPARSGPVVAGRGRHRASRSGGPGQLGDRRVASAEHRPDGQRQRAEDEEDDRSRRSSCRADRWSGPGRRPTGRRSGRASGTGRRARPSRRRSPRRTRRPRSAPRSRRQRGRS